MKARLKQVQDSVETGVIGASEHAAVTVSPVRATQTNLATFSPRHITIAALTIALGGTALWAGMRIARASGQVADTAHILPGVRVADIPVGGMTREEAQTKLKEWARAQVKNPVTFFAPVSGRRWNLALADAGGRFDVEEALEQALAVGRKDSFLSLLVNGGKDRDTNIAVPFRFNEAQLDKKLAEIGKAVYVAPKNAKAKINAEGEIAVAGLEVKGVRLDPEATKAALLKDGVESLRDGGYTDLVVAEELPHIAAADIKKLNHKLGTFTTYYGSSSSNRQHNVEKAAGRISGTLLAPGDTFSYNEVVGPREPELGWLNAPTYQDGQVVPGPGGGVCQVSTTLYNAALRANLKIVARTGHSMPVHYVPAGLDATVAYGSIDFKFQNSHKTPLLVVGKANGENLTFTLFGQEPTEKVALVSGPRRTNARGGITVTTYREVTQADGTQRREVLSTDSYRPHGASASQPVRRAVRRAAPSTPAQPKPVAPASAPAAHTEV